MLMGSISLCRPYTLYPEVYLVTLSGSSPFGSLVPLCVVGVSRGFVRPSSPLVDEGRR